MINILKEKLTPKKLKSQKEKELYLLLCHTSMVLLKKFMLMNVFLPQNLITVIRNKIAKLMVSVKDVNEFLKKKSLFSKFTVA